jgi:3-deoxy-D-manno-octulosonic-acid transferase
MYLVYSFLFTLGVLLTAPYYVWRRRRELRGGRWRERFGFLPDSFRQTERGAIWVHAVSVGETLAVVGLVRELQQAFPERPIFLSHVTPTGREAGESRLPSVAGRFYLPLDWRWSVRRALGHLRPALLVIAETELWPNLLRTARESAARVVMVNARLSDRSFRRYRLAPGFMRRALSDVDAICAQTKRDAARFVALGARAGGVMEAGNLKFDALPPKLGELPRILRTAMGRAHRAPIMIAASTMAGEEPQVLEAWEKVRARHPKALLILAPRHPARFEEVGRILKDAGRSFVRRSTLKAGEDKLGEQLAGAEILLLDTIGELAGIFELADVVFMGGSLVSTGGHNVLEPAYWSKPILFGPHMENFRDIAQLFLEADAAVEVRDAAQLAECALRLFEDGTAAREMGERARQVLERESGATERTLKQIQALLELQMAPRSRV